MILIVIAVAAAVSPEAERLGRELAGSGTIEVILPTLAAKEIGEVISDHPELDAKDQEILRDVGKRVAEEEREKLISAFGHQYALALSIEDLRSLAAFNRSTAAINYRKAMPKVTVQGLAALGKLDFKSDLKKAYCEQTSKLCIP
jgi:hypothetical protein